VDFTEIKDMARVAGASTDLTRFVHRSVLPAGAADVFAWHERPEALRALLPSSRFVRILEQTGGVRDGARVVFAFGVGRLRLVWEAVHYGYVEGARFCDEQVRGPFRTWRHAHRVHPRGDGRSVLEDHVEFALPGGPLVRRIAEPIAKRLLAASFRRRHVVTRRAVLAARGEAGGPRGAVRGHRLERAQATRRLRRLRSASRSRSALVAFHSRHKVQLLAHSPALCAELGRLVARPGPARRDWWRDYAATFRAALAVPATRPRHVNALQHLAGHFRGRLHAVPRESLHRAIEDYGQGRVPLGVPREIVRAEARRCGLDYVLAQTYLCPEETRDV
jgi:uncharacterized protein YbgA (DUF1722 family)/ligand-binding SRPBCC domain-containing protein